jgi:hypothetical protein
MLEILYTKLTHILNVLNITIEGSKVYKDFISIVR